MSRRAQRFHQRYTKAELAEQVRQLHSEPANQQAGELHLLTPAARRKLDDLLWAIYWHDAPQGNTRQRTVQPQPKWW